MTSHKNPQNKQKSGDTVGTRYGLQMDFDQISGYQIQSTSD